MKIPLSNPDITQKEIDAVVEVLKTPALSLGPKLPDFERKFAKYIGTKYAIAVNSGTSGLHLCIKALGIGPGDEVITTPFSFIASANCILFEKAKPVFVDINEEDWNIDEDQIEAKITKKTKAILPVHVFGYPCNMKKIRQIAQKHKLAIIEDACEAIGAKLGARHAGTFSNAAVFAFYPNKQMTTGEGGMIVTNDKQIDQLCRSLRNQGRDQGMGWLGHNRLGYNYRLSDINCALGIAQLSRLKEILRKRQEVAENYLAELVAIPDLHLPLVSNHNLTRSWFVFVVRLVDHFSGVQRDQIINALRHKGISCNVYFPPIHLQPFYRRDFGYRQGSFPITEKIGQRTIALPFFNKLSRQAIRRVAKALKSSINEVKRNG